MRSRKTKIDLSGIGSAVAQSIQQVLEVLTGEFVEFEYLGIAHYLCQRPEHYVDTSNIADPLEFRDVEVHGAGKFFPTHRRFEISVDLIMSKRIHKAWYERWEVRNCTFKLTCDDDEKTLLYRARWEYPVGDSPEVAVVEQFSDQSCSPKLRIGRDRSERREELSVPLSVPV